MAESEAGTGNERRFLYPTDEDLRVPKVGSSAAEGRYWGEKYCSERSIRAGAIGAAQEQSKFAQASPGGVSLAVIGTSHLAFCTAVAAARNGFTVYPEEEIEKAELVIVAEDTPTTTAGIRNEVYIADKIRSITSEFVVVASQVSPGFCKRMGTSIYHQPEQLRILSATENALHPHRIVVGCAQPTKFEELPAAYRTYLTAFNWPVLLMSYEEAEFSKIAINMWLAAQVDTTNRLAAAAAKVGASWERIAEAMRLDPRIGKDAYLTPGRWQDSLHLLRDHVTLTEIEHK